MVGEKDTKNGPNYEPGVPLFISPRDTHISQNLPSSLPYDNALLNSEELLFSKKNGRARRSYERIKKEYSQDRHVASAVSIYGVAMRRLYEVIKRSDDLGAQNTHIDHQALVAHHAGALVNVQDQLKKMKK